MYRRALVVTVLVALLTLAATGVASAQGCIEILGWHQCL